MQDPGILYVAALVALVIIAGVGIAIQLYCLADGAGRSMLVNPIWFLFRDNFPGNSIFLQRTYIGSLLICFVLGLYMWQDNNDRWGSGMEAHNDCTKSPNLVLEREI